MLFFTSFSRVNAPLEAQKRKKITVCWSSFLLLLMPMCTKYLAFCAKILRYHSYFTVLFEYFGTEGFVPVLLLSFLSPSSIFLVFLLTQRVGTTRARMRHPADPGTTPGTGGWRSFPPLILEIFENLLFADRRRISLFFFALKLLGKLGLLIRALQVPLRVLKPKRGSQNFTLPTSSSRHRQQCVWMVWVGVSGKGR